MDASRSGKRWGKAMENEAFEAILELRAAKKQQYPCTNCNEENKEDCMCNAWKEWFRQEWRGIRRSADKLREKAKRKVD